MWRGGGACGVCVWGGSGKCVCVGGGEVWACGGWGCVGNDVAMRDEGELGD